MSSYSTCPLCDRDKYMSRPKELYGHSVCKKCVNSFANRRQLAWFIDMLIIRIGILGVSFFIGYLVAATIVSARGSVSDSDMAMFSAIDWGFFLVGLLLVVCKDGFSGRSPGKVLTGVQVVDKDTLKPIGFMASMKRNWPTLIPIVPIICGMQLLKGPRWGDKFANTFVIWNRHADNPVFSNGTIPQSETSFDFVSLPVEPSTSTNPYEAPRY